MKLNEIITSLKSETPLPFSDLFQINVKYMPILVKRQMVRDITNFSVYLDEETKLMRRDNILVKILTTLFLTLQFTDIEIDELFDENGDINIELAVSAYDDLMETAIYAEICKHIDDVIYDIDCLVECELNEKINNYNSSGGVLQRIFEYIMEKVPDADSIKNMIQEIPLELEGLKNLEMFTLPNAKKTTKKSKS
jgi:hypothetical protein